MLPKFKVQNEVECALGSQPSQTYLSKNIKKREREKEGENLERMARQIFLLNNNMVKSS